MEGIEDNMTMCNQTILPSAFDEIEREHSTKAQHVLVQPDGTEASTEPEDNGMDLTQSNSEEKTPHFPKLQSVLSLYDKVMSKVIPAEQLAADESEEVDAVERMLLSTKSQLLESRTARLWLQYMDMADILKKFLRAERTGNWKLHLHSLQEMLPYLASAGHCQYTKSVYIYLQHMQQLKDSHPDVFNAFMHGYHVLRQSDRYWAGLSTDLVTEQVLMRSVKSAGGLTRGRGMGDSQRTQWLLSMPACADMNSAMQELTGLVFSTSDQHVEAGETRQKKDEQDRQSLLRFLLNRNPFAGDMSLRNISTGVTADPTVNADSAKAVGNTILQSMQGSAVKEFKFKKKDQVVTMDVKVCAKVDGESIQVDPQLLFQRLVTAANGQPDESELSSLFEFEHSTPPPSLFEPSGLLRESHKSGLADALMTTAKGEPPLEDEEEGQIVLDGGSLLHKMPWRKHDSFSTICRMYADYVCRRYKEPIVVFDSYESGPTTKDLAHLRRSAGIVGPAVHFTEDMLLTSRKDHFLSNPSNKQAFVFLLGRVLESRGCRILHAKGDADNMIVRTALECSVASKTTVIGEDTDLLVLLCHHAQLHRKLIFLRSDKHTGSKKRVWHIQWLKQNLGPETCQLLPFVHALHGCDTTSRLFGIGKSVPLKKLTDSNFRKQGHIFCSAGHHQDAIIAAGEKALVCLYNGCTEDTLDTLRYRRFCEKVSSCTTPVQIQSLRPSTSAAKYHSLRVYLQVQV